MTENSVDSSLDTSGQNNSIEEPFNKDGSNVGDYQQQSKYTAVKSKYKEAKQ